MTLEVKLLLAAMTLAYLWLAYRLTAVERALVNIVEALKALAEVQKLLKSVIVESRGEETAGVPAPAGERLIARLETLKQAVDLAERSRKDRERT